MEEKEIIEMTNEENNDSVISEAQEHNSHHHSHHHSHRHHHHSSRHHRSHSNSSGKKGKFKKFVRKNKKKLINAAVALILVAALIVIGAVVDHNTNNDDKKDKNANAGDSGGIVIRVPFLSEEVSIIGEAAKKFVDNYPDIEVADVYQKTEEQTRADFGLPVTIPYSIEGIPDGYSIEKISVYVSENKDFSDARLINPKNVNEDSVKIYHLKTGTKYYFRITAEITGDMYAGAEGSFKTAAGPRILSVDSVGNMRDIGGYNTSFGLKVKQGLLYRGCEIDGAVEPSYAASEKGISDMLKILGIKTDMDLRTQDEVHGVADPLGVGVNHIIYGAPMYLQIYEEQNKETVRKIFSDLAKRENYPVYMHCTYGMDRTGTVCFLLGALLGVDEQDLMMDYELSGLYHSELWSTKDMGMLINRLKMQAGNNLCEKVENYLLSIGVTPAEIQSIRDIFLA